MLQLRPPVRPPKPGLISSAPSRAASGPGEFGAQRLERLVALRGAAAGGVGAGAAAAAVAAAAAAAAGTQAAQRRHLLRALRGAGIPVLRQETKTLNPCPS